MPLCITDLLFNVIGFLILLIAISNFEEKMDSNEKVLKELHLSQHEEISGMKISNASIFINIFLENEQPVIEVEGRRFSLDALGEYLKSMGGAANVAIRCEENILVGFNNKVLAVCKSSGIENIDQVVKINK